MDSQTPTGGSSTWDDSFRAVELPRRSVRTFLACASLVLGLTVLVVWRRSVSTPQQLAAAARRSLQAGRLSQAESLLKRVSERWKGSADFASVQAELDLARGRPDDAIDRLRSIPAVDPAAARARLVAGQIEKNRNRVRAAEALFLEALRVDPRLALARRELIVIYAMQARRAELNDQFRALAELEPLKFDDVLLWTASLEDIWINETIRADLERYLAADPDDRQSRLALGSVLLRSGDVDQAESILQPLPEHDAEARLLRARIALSRNDLAQVSRLLADGPAAHPGFAVGRGQLAARSNDPAGAASQFQIALEQDPANREAIQGLSLALAQLDRRDEADVYRKKGGLWRTLTGLLERARASSNQHDQGLYSQLGRTCEALGRTPEAAAWYRLALGLDPANAEAQQALYRLRPRPE
jgi:tetratricopeptide (TPR) repeat protein